MAVEKGDKIKVEYEGKFDSGEVFDTTTHGDHSHPLEFVVGSGHVIKGFEEAVEGMNEGDEKDFSIEPEEAYGRYNEELKREFPREQIPLQQEPQEGMVLAFNTPDGKQFPAKIVSFDDKTITFDLNHPLAGQKLNFHIKIAGVEKGSEKPAEEGKKDDLEDIAE